MATDDERPEDEPRAIDIVAGRVAPEDLDPETIEQLARWFGPPSDSAPPPDEEDPAIAALREARKRATEAVDPQLVAQIESWTTSAERLIHLPPPMELVADESIAKFDISAWGLRAAGEPRELERPEDIDDALQERTPQALLRDLHRPVTYFGDIYMEMLDTGLDVGGTAARAAVQEAIHAVYTVRIFDEFDPRRWIDEEFTELRSRLAEPWENAGKRKTAEALPTAQLEQHFGKPKR